MKKKHHAYVVNWRDSSCLRGWHPVNSSDHGVAAIFSVGWLVRETPKEITISTSISDGGRCTEALTIPREAITRMTKLKNYVSGE